MFIIRNDGLYTCYSYTYMYNTIRVDSVLLKSCVNGEISCKNNTKINNIYVIQFEMVR